MSDRFPYRAVLGSDGHLTIPSEIRRLSGLSDGDLVEFEVVEGRIVITRVGPVDAEDAWFWTEEWQEKERQADEALDAGRTTFYPDDESFLRSLRSHD